MMLLTLLLACPATDPAPTGGGVPFPHPEEYAHGADAMEYSTACVGCHRDEGAPTCTSCHDYPHSIGWLAGSKHGQGDLTTCFECHGSQEVAPDCQSCHSSYPHSETWTEQDHGAHTLAQGSPELTCGSCHGDELQGDGEVPACSSCHSYPHPDDHVAKHQNGGTDGCSSCHGELGEGGATGVACSSCHAGYPHAPDWTLGHIEAGKLRGEGACLQCHEPGDGPSTMPATCGQRCHGGQP